jgi:FHA domain
VRDDWLEVTRGPAAGERLEVGRELTVGRAQSGVAGLGGDPELSRTHARFWRAAGGELIVEDLGSANGTFVDGERIDRPAVLGVGDTVQLGATTLAVRSTRPASSPSAQPTRVRGRPAPIPEPLGGPAGGLSPANPRLVRLVWLLALLLVLALAGLGVALATRGSGTSAAVLHNSTVVDPLFPVTGLRFSGELATFRSSSTRGAVSAVIDWGDGSAPTRGTIGGPAAAGNGAYTRPVSGTHTYTRVGTYALTVTVTAANADLDRGSNLAVVTNCFCVTKLPTFARSVDLGPVSGQVSFRLPGAGSFVPLTAPREVPVGSQLDTTSGSVVMMAATAVAGKLGSGEFDGGTFQILQTQALGGLVELKLQPPSTAGCLPTNLSRALALLHASVRGSFQTQGRYSAATVRGTEWTTTEQCDGTLTRVQRGSVTVRDFRTRRTIVLLAGQSYLAPSS